VTSFLQVFKSNFHINFFFLSLRGGCNSNLFVLWSNLLYHIWKELWSYESACYEISLDPSPNIPLNIPFSDTHSVSSWWQTTSLTLTHPTKASGYDLITGKRLKELSRKGLRAITQIYNATFKLEYFPCHWKMGQIIMIPKPGKNPSEVTSYRPKILLPLLSKILEKIILQRLTDLSSKESHPSSPIRFQAKTRNYTTGAQTYTPN
jgi:hypothetical protein